MASASQVEIPISFQLTVSDIYRANVAITRGNFLRPSTLIFLVAMVAAGGVVFVLAFRSFDPATPMVIGGLWALLFLPVFLLTVFYVPTYFGARSLYKRDPNVSQPTRYSFTNDLIRQEVATGRSELKWTTFVKARETRDMFFLYVRRSRAYPIPKRAFASEEDIAHFRRLVRDHIKDAPLKS